jgi:hypothetical protein
MACGRHPYVVGVTRVERTPGATVAVRVDKPGNEPLAAEVLYGTGVAGWRWPGADAVDSPF